MPLYWYIIFLSLIHTYWKISNPINRYLHCSEIFTVHKHFSEHKNSFLSEHWHFLILYMSGSCCWFYAVMETTSNTPLRLAKARNISLIEFDNRGLIATYSPAPVLVVQLEADALWCTQITANTRNAFPPGGLWRLQGGKKMTQAGGVSPGAACVFVIRPGWHVHTNRRLQVFCGGLFTSARLSLGWQLGCKQRLQHPEKTDKPLILSKSQGTSCVNPTKKDMVGRWRRRINDG